MNVYLVITGYIHGLKHRGYVPIEVHLVSPDQMEVLLSRLEIVGPREFACLSWWTYVDPGSAYEKIRQLLLHQRFYYNLPAMEAGIRALKPGQVYRIEHT